MRANNREFQLKKPVILFIYGYACQLCGLVSTSNHVHHIDKNGNNHNGFNLLPLCNRCHKLAHSSISIAFPDPDLSISQEIQYLNSFF